MDLGPVVFSLVDTTMLIQEDALLKIMFNTLIIIEMKVWSMEFYTKIWEELGRNYSNILSTPPISINLFVASLLSSGI